MGQHSRLRPRLRRTRPYLLALACAVFVLSAGVAGYALAGSEPVPLTVRVDGRQLRLVNNRPTVADALRSAGITPRDGALFSIVSHRRLDPHAFPARVFLDGELAKLKTPIRANARIATIAGHDELEPVERRQVPAASAAGLPDVENHLWRVGQSGVDDVEVGKVSGEITRRFAVQAASGAVAEQGPVVALTFDDGPDPRWTPMVLDILRTEKVRATFCVVGYLATRFPELVRAVADQGHALCNHTEHHVLRLDKHPHSQIVDEVQQGADAIKAIIGRDALLYRPPGGAISPEVVEVAHQRGERVLKWSIDPSDYRKPGAGVIHDHIIGAIHNGAVILMHDGGGDRSQTVDQLRALIRDLRARGFSFATPTD
jgi:peptidoglycan/xylan/chitin deacetylase (PgdA/CDA1 family)